MSPHYRSNQTEKFWYRKVLWHIVLAQSRNNRTTAWLANITGICQVLPTGTSVSRTSYTDFLYIGAFADGKLKPRSFSWVTKSIWNGFRKTFFIYKILYETPVAKYTWDSQSATWTQRYGNLLLHSNQHQRGISQCTYDTVTRNQDWQNQKSFEGSVRRDRGN